MTDKKNNKNNKQSKKASPHKSSLKKSQKDTIGYIFNSKILKVLLIVKILLIIYYVYSLYQSKREAQLEFILQQEKNSPTFIDPKGHSYKILNRFFRSTNHYTQGFKYIGENLLLHSTGNFGKSKIQYELLKSDKSQMNIVEIIKEENLLKEEFGEGCDIIEMSNGQKYIFQLTWQNKVILVYESENLKRIASIDLPDKINEGWGLTHNPLTRKVYQTNGTAKIFTCSVDLREGGLSLGEVTFLWECNNGQDIFEDLGTGYRAVNMLNELEYKDGLLYINQFLTNYIRVFDLEKWELMKTYDMWQLKKDVNKIMVQKYKKKLLFDEVMNGITWNFDNNTWLLTGKHWPVVYEIEWYN